MKTIRNYILETSTNLSLNEMPRPRTGGTSRSNYNNFASRSDSPEQYKYWWEKEDAWKDLDRKVKAGEISKDDPEYIELQRAFKYGTHPEYRMMGSKASRVLSTATDAVNTIDSIVAIGNTISSIISNIYHWQSSLGEYLSKRKKHKSFSNISKLAAALAAAYVSNNDVEKRKIISMIRTQPDIQGIPQFKKIMVAEICLNFLAADISNETTIAVQESFPRTAHTSEVQKILNMRNERRELEAFISEEIDSFGRNLTRYTKTFR